MVSMFNAVCEKVANYSGLDATLCGKIGICVFNTVRLHIQGCEALVVRHGSLTLSRVEEHLEGEDLMVKCLLENEEEFWALEISNRNVWLLVNMWVRIGWQEKDVRLDAAPFVFDLCFSGNSYINSPNAYWDAFYWAVFEDRETEMSGGRFALESSDKGVAGWHMKRKYGGEYEFVLTDRDGRVKDKHHMSVGDTPMVDAGVHFVKNYESFLS